MFAGVDSGRICARIPKAARLCISAGPGPVPGFKNQTATLFLGRLGRYTGDPFVNTFGWHIEELGDAKNISLNADRQHEELGERHGGNLRAALFTCVERMRGLDAHWEAGR